VLYKLGKNKNKNSICIVNMTTIIESNTDEDICAVCLQKIDSNIETNRSRKKHITQFHTDCLQKIVDIIKNE
jgi:hypothetical protein